MSWVATTYKCVQSNRGTDGGWRFDTWRNKSGARDSEKMWDYFGWRVYMIEFGDWKPTWKPRPNLISPTHFPSSLSPHFEVQTETGSSPPSDVSKQRSSHGFRSLIPWVKIYSTRAGVLHPLRLSMSYRFNGGEFQSLPCAIWFQTQTSSASTAKACLRS